MVPIRTRMLVLYLSTYIKWDYYKNNHLNEFI